MTDYWNMIKEKLHNENGIMSIGVSDIVGSGISAVFWLYIASVIDPGDYGEIHYFLGIVGMAQILSMFGNSNALTVYSAKNENIQSTLFLLSIIPTVVSCITIIILFDRVDAGLLVIGYVVFQSANAVLLGRKYYRKYAKMILIQKSLTIVLGISFFHFIGPEGIIFALAFTFIPHLIIFSKEFKTTKINFSVLRLKMKFITNNYFMTLSGGFGGQIDKIILAPLLGFNLLGNYSLSLQLFTILVMFSSIAFKFLLPQDASGISNKKIKKIVIITSFGISILGFFALPKLIPIFFPKFIDTVDAIGIMSLAVVPEAITMLYMSKMLGRERSKFILIAKLISLTTIILGFITLGPIFGISGLAAIIVIASILQAGFLAFSNKFLESEKNEK
jgi:O-antigen/teichoic acid export membrane protein